MNINSEQVVAGWLLILSGVIFLPAGILYTGRAIWKWTVAQSHSYLSLERSMVITAFTSLALGLLLLERLLEANGETILSPLGMAITLTGTVLLFMAETFFLSKNEWIYAAVVTFVILSLLGQGMFGLSVLYTGLLAAWVGWVTVIWSLAWLLILPIARPQNMYYPWLHFVTPLLIGIALLTA